MYFYVHMGKDGATLYRSVTHMSLRLLCESVQTICRPFFGVLNACSSFFLMTTTLYDQRPFLIELVSPIDKAIMPLYMLRITHWSIDSQKAEIMEMPITEEQLFAFTTNLMLFLQNHTDTDCQG